MQNSLFLMLFTGLFITNVFAQSLDKDELLTSKVEGIIQHKGKKPLHSMLLYVEDEQVQYVFHHASGLIDRKSIPAQPDDRFDIASITKTFLAVVVLQLMEEGKLELDDPVGQYLGEIDFLRFDEFLLQGDTNYAQQVTIRHLLRHESGIGDMFIDTKTRFIMSVMFHKKRQYDLEMINDRYFKYNLNKKPHFKPGQGYFYADTNYYLLGLLIEELTGKELHVAIRERILESLDMKNTHWKYQEVYEGTSRQQYTNLNRIKLIGNINTSYEWGGGGLVSTTSELATFIQAVFEGKLFQNDETLALMTSKSNHETNYGMGMWRLTLEDRLYYGHGGFYGSLMLFDPEARVTLVASASQADPDFDAIQFVTEVIDLASATSSANQD